MNSVSIRLLRLKPSVDLQTRPETLYAGSMRKGRLRKRSKLEGYYKHKGSRLWDTPVVSDRVAGKMRKLSILTTALRGGQVHFTGQLILCDIPSTRFPAIEEWIMGLPQGWSDLDILHKDQNNNA